MKSAAIGLALCIPLFIIGVFGCSYPNDGRYALNPVNPDPAAPSYTDADPLVDIGYTIYANVGNAIRSFNSNDSTNYTEIVTGLDPATPDFKVTDDGNYLVFARDSDGGGNSGHFLVVHNISTGAEVVLAKDSLAQSLENEFTVSDDQVIYSNNGELLRYDISSGNYMVVNSDSASFNCSHFPTAFSDGMVTFQEHEPEEFAGAAHIIEYDGTAQHTVLLPSHSYGGSRFGTLYYPISFDGDAFMAMLAPTSCDVLVNWPSFTGSSRMNTVVCPDTLSPVQFCKMYQTPGGARVVLYGHGSIYWFDSSSRPLISGDLEVHGRDFTSAIDRIVGTPDTGDPTDTYLLFQDNHGIWIYDNTMTQMNCRFEWLNQADEVLWLEVN